MSSSEPAGSSYSCYHVPMKAGDMHSGSMYSPTSYKQAQQRRYLITVYATLPCQEVVDLFGVLNSQHYAVKREQKARKQIY